MVLSIRRKGLAEAGHDYHPAPKTHEITGFSDLKKGKKKTPVQGGGGLRDRWLDAKGRKRRKRDRSILTSTAPRSPRARSPRR
ncbi:colicin E3/pyocin S6 family cytotoxin [Pseudomonas sp. R1-6]|uniref:colicin E3/pyocin S6 family cytotoxin n=1 Tax=Pseudomonas sp. R1-6 TaxID=2817397 RepID=UPI003DA8165D